MAQTAEIVTVVSTLGCAIGIGFIMQSGDVAEARYGSGDLIETRSAALVGTPAVKLAKSELITVRTLEPLEVTSITLTSAGRQPIVINDKSDLLIKTAVEVPSGEETGGVENLSQADTTCPIQAVAEQSAAAMIQYELSAPCLARMPVLISHNGLTFSDILDDAGELDLLVPALSEEAWVTATFQNGETVEAVAWIDSVPLYDRVVVQWHGNSGLQVHAREFGAAYGEDGHVWSGAPRDFTAVSLGKGGFLTALGDASLPQPVQAEVYTFPSALGHEGGEVSLSVEAEVTQANCSQDIAARAFQFIGGKRVSSQDLALTIPGCDAVGNFLVLNNLLQDLTVAQK